MSLGMPYNSINSTHLAFDKMPLIRFSANRFLMIGIAQIVSPSAAQFIRMLTLFLLNEFIFYAIGPSILGYGWVILLSIELPCKFNILHKLVPLILIKAFPFGITATLELKNADGSFQPYS